MPTEVIIAAITAAAAIAVAAIEARAAKNRKKDKEDTEAYRKHREAKEKAQEDLLVLLIQSTRASIALGEATAHALQRGYTNGDTEAALEYATSIKNKQKDFLAEQGVHAILE